MALDDYLPFDPDGLITDTGDKVQEALDEYGYSTWRDIFVDFQDPSFEPDPDALRGTIYSTPEEALIDMFERGLLEFTQLWYDPLSDTYGIYVDYEEPA